MSPIVSIQKNHAPLTDTPFDGIGTSYLQPSIEPKPSSPSVASASIVFSICVLAFISGPIFLKIFQVQNFFIRIAFTQIVFILLPALLTVYVLRYPLKKSLRLNAISLKNIALSVGMLLSSLPLIYTFTLIIFLSLGQRLERSFVPEIPSANNLSQLFMHLIFIALFAGFCEEFLFRGFLMRGYEQLGIKTSILITSTLFALMHLSILRMPATFLLGLLIGFVVYRTNSLFAGMFLHFCNNALAVLISYWITKIAPLGTPLNTAAYSTMNLETLSDLEKILVFVFAFVLFGFCILLFGSLFLFFLTKFLKSTQTTYQPSLPSADKKKKLGLLFLLPALVIIGFFFVQELFSIFKVDSSITL